MSIRNNYKHTLFACFIGYSTQALTVIFAPLLFVIFNKTYGISLSKITLLVTVSFLIQLSTDFFSLYFVQKFGYRVSSVTASFMVAVGIAGLGIFPDIFPSSYFGLIIATLIYSIGGGMEEVCFNPIAEGCPTKHKSAIMSLLHSFFSWGMVIITLLSTAYFRVFGLDNWRYLCVILALFPFFNAIYFCFVPIYNEPYSEKSLGFSCLLKNRMFWVLLLLMVCSGAAELGMSQWASAFAETGLKVSKSTGDLLGPCLFGVLMGIARVSYAKFSKVISLKKFMILSSMLCIFSYLLTVFAKQPIISLIGCGLCGMSVGIMWPGTISICSKMMPSGGAKMYALLALFGDAGCTLGPMAVGFISSAVGGDLKIGLAFSIIYPLLMMMGLIILNRRVPNE